MEQPIETDPNIAAFEADLKAGMLNDVPAGHFVAYHRGRRVDTGPDSEVLTEFLKSQGMQAVFVAQVDIPEATRAENFVPSPYGPIL